MNLLPPKKGSLFLRLNGGLGNQLFQYAAAFAMARAWQKTLWLEIPPRRHQQFLGHPRPYALDRFCVSARPFPCGLLLRLLTSRAPRLQPLTEPWRALISLETRDERPGATIGSCLSLAPLGRHVSVSGYWQDPAWSGCHEEDLRREFRFRHPPPPKSQALLELLARSPLTISIHVRRGDLAQVQPQALLPPEYFRQALATLTQALPAKHTDQAEILVFSDDLSWCRQHLEFLRSDPRPLPGCRLHWVDFYGDSQPEEDIRLISSCHHHILAHGSFSWWGAWLNPRPDKIIVRPVDSLPLVGSVPLALPHP
jgi:hypothetical protein